MYRKTRQKMYVGRKCMKDQFENVEKLDIKCMKDQVENV